MTKHTPGPREVTQYENFRGYSIWAKDRGCISERWYDTDQKPPYGDEIEVNARLISAAPLAAELADMVLRDTDLFPDSMRWQEIVAKAHEMKAKMGGK